jgi:two-component system response regulator RegA
MSTETTGRILLIDDDATFVHVLTRALSARGFEVSGAQDGTQALALCVEQQPKFVVLDLKLGAESGLALIPKLLAARPGLRILLLTGYASIATAVEAIKRGAHDYLAKPVDADQVVQALLGNAAQHATATMLPDAPPPLKRLEWEHIQRVLAECEGNISEAARRLGLHRRTLQRKLAKRPVREARADTSQA